MILKFHRRMSPRAFAVVAVLLTVLLCLYYSNFTSDIRDNATGNGQSAQSLVGESSISHNFFWLGGGTQSFKDTGTCPKLTYSKADIDTLQVFKQFDFQPTWMKNKEYWDKTFEERFESLKKDSTRPPLKVILVPHSHNDPGWLKTFEQYFHYESKQILNNIVAKLQQWPNMTFIWSEVSFLSMWWDSAHPTKQKALRKLLQDGRLEITTGGWVMTDEANSHIYAMLDQLIEGHQWLKSKLDIKPKSGWSIDPFGHGSTVPYLLSTSGITGTVIQRIHYAWKQWFAKHQYGDFYWLPAWETKNDRNSFSDRTQILTHNQPFDIYSIKHSCGPHPYICLNFDFRKLIGEYTEYSIKAQNINDKNVKQKSELLLEQYARTGSLFPHNVVLMPIGDDFRYNQQIEFDQQYTNYKQLADYINSNKKTYNNTEIVFGTPKTYFEEILKRYEKYPKLRGDFFVYSDIFTEGRPAYWSGYFTTRPFMKILDRELEHNLRTAEILYTVALNKARQNNVNAILKILERNFEKLVKARRNLGLFQHHDAITGTSKYFVMRDYGLKLFESVQDAVTVQQDAIQMLLVNNSTVTENTRNVLLSDMEYESYEKLPRKLPVMTEKEKEKRIVLFNSLGQARDEIIQVRSTKVNVQVLDPNQNPVSFQINPVWNITNLNMKLQMLPDEYEILFLAKIPAFSVVAYYIVEVNEETIKNNIAVVYCNDCQREEVPATHSSKFTEENEENPKKQNEERNIPLRIKPSKFKIRNTQPGDIQLENNKMKLLFDGPSGFLKTVTKKNSQKVTQCAINFSAYHSAQFHSGAYLFMPDPNTREAEKNVLEQYENVLSIIITSGPIASEVTAIYGPFLIHTVRIYHVLNSVISDSIYIENEIDFENPPKNRETELFMRIVSDIQNGDPPEFYSDLNGFQIQKRVKIERIGIEGNYFPITTMAFIQDENLRLSLLTNHAQGAASWQPGYLEVMLDRRTLYDDSRGMGEGLVDSRRTVTKFWLLLEEMKDTQPIRFKRSPPPNRVKRDSLQNIEQNFEDEEIIRNFNMDSEMSEKFIRPSLYANLMSNSLNYPVNIYVSESSSEMKLTSSLALLNRLPCDTHLLTFRTQPDSLFPQFPSTSALLVLHRQGYDCDVGKAVLHCDLHSFASEKLSSNLKVHSMESTSLTGLHSEGILNSLTNLKIQPMGLKTLNVTFDK